MHSPIYQYLCPKTITFVFSENAYHFAQMKVQFLGCRVKCVCVNVTLGIAGIRNKRRSLVHTTARETLGVILDSRLTLSAHVTALCRSGYYQLSAGKLHKAAIVTSSVVLSSSASSRMHVVVVVLLYGLVSTRLQHSKNIQSCVASQ